jgi:hypothetical protein
MKFTAACLAAMVLLVFMDPPPSKGEGAQIETMKEEIRLLKERLQNMEQRLLNAERKAAEARAKKVKEEEKKKAAKEEKSKHDIKIGGALRVNYAYMNFSEPSEAKKGGHVIRHFPPGDRRFPQRLSDFGPIPLAQLPGRHPSRMGGLQFQREMAGADRCHSGPVRDSAGCVAQLVGRSALTQGWMTTTTWA